MDQAAALPTLSHARPLPAGNVVFVRACTLAVVLCAAALIAAYVIMQSGLQVKASEFGPFVAVAVGMYMIAGYARYRKMGERLTAAASIVATATLSLMICGLVSNIGLRLRAPLIDPFLARADDMIGWNVERAVPAFAAHPWLIDSLSLAYNLSGSLVAVCILVALLAGRVGKAWELLITMVITMQVIAAISITAPARGAMSYFDLLYLQGNGLPTGAGVYHLDAFDYLHSGSGLSFGLADMSGLVTFPSFHTVLALLLAQALAETRFYLLGIAASAVVIVSTIPIGGHYVTDILAGAAIWLSGAVIARRIESHLAS